MHDVSTFKHPTVMQDGVVTHVVVPVAEYERLTCSRRPPTESEIAEAVRILSDPSETWHDAESVLREIVRGGLQAARKHAGMTQEELAAELGLSQPQVSRLERDPEKTSVRTLRRVAELIASRLRRPPEGTVSG